MPDSKTSLSPIQESRWRSYRAKASGDHTDQVTLSARLRGPLDEKALTAALEHVLEAREDLRPALPGGSEGEGAGRAGPRPVTVPEPVELSRHDAGRREEALARLVTERTGRGLDLETGPPVRVALARLADDDHALIVTAHRLVADEHVLAGLAEEISRAYEDATGATPAASEGAPGAPSNGHRSTAASNGRARDDDDNGAADGGVHRALHRPGRRSAPDPARPRDRGRPVHAAG
ncbi:condensation domain-containing protein, partial [Streptosporangium sp. NPDC048865]|uniref:condensation domain-containing protein n=1 Tax=Streptosporangium sp. NPDC048865 TaxID=3155766 RepID=UPI00343492F8